VSENAVESREPTVSRRIVAVRFVPIGKLYHFDATSHPEVQPGDRVVVETTRGRQVGEVVCFVDPGQSNQKEPDGSYKPIERLASPRELAMQQCWKTKEDEAVAAARKRALQLDLREVKIVRAEFSYDGARLTILVSTPDENGRLEVKSLREDMQGIFPEAQVSVRQIGPRDAAKLIGGMGACGLGSRCCCRFLVDFNPVSIKMAKEQGISLNPEEITGMCGRLRCCMAYEFEQYAAVRKTLPKRNKLVMTAKGQGKVVDVNPLKETIFVEVHEGEDYRVIELGRTEFEVIGVPGAPGVLAVPSQFGTPAVDSAPVPAPIAEPAPPAPAAAPAPQGPRRKSKSGRGGQSRRGGDAPRQAEASKGGELPKGGGSPIGDEAPTPSEAPRSNEPAAGGEPPTGGEPSAGNELPTSGEMRSR
jgi:cell fate regulator YaaT (PSP1 superfamily)